MPHNLVTQPRGAGLPLRHAPICKAATARFPSMQGPEAYGIASVWCVCCFECFPFGIYFNWRQNLDQGK